MARDVALKRVKLSDEVWATVEVDREQAEHAGSHTLLDARIVKLHVARDALLDDD